MKTQVTLKRLMALALSIVMVLTLAPITAFAQDDDGADLTEQLITIASLDALDETTVLWQGFNVGEVQLEDIILPSELTGEDSDANPLTISGVTWSSENFEPDIVGYYQFNMALPSGYALAESVSLPIITVVIGVLGGGDAQPFAAGDIIWDSSTPPTLTADDNGKTVLIKQGASNNLFIPSSVDVYSLTIKGPGLGIPITGMSISIRTGNPNAHITLTIEDLNITALPHVNAVDAGHSHTMTLHLKNVSLNGGPGISSNGGNGISSAHGNIIIHAEEDVSLTGAATNASNLFGGVGIGAGYGKITIYGDLTAVGAKGIQASANPLYIHGNVTAIGKSTIASSGHEYHGVESKGNVFISARASLTAKGYYGVGMGPDTTLDLAGSLNAEAEGAGGKTALLVPSDSQVMFSNPAATMIVKDLVPGPNSKINVSIDSDLSDYTLRSFGGVTLDPPANTATSSATTGTVYLDYETDQTILIWDGINNVVANAQGYYVATSNGVDIDLAAGGQHENITTIIATATAEGTLIIPNGKTNLTIRGSDTTPDFKTEITNAQIRGENGTTNVNLTLQDLQITSPDIYYALFHSNPSDYKMTVNCENVTLIGADYTIGRPAIRAESPMIINGELEAIGGNATVNQGGNGIEVVSELIINGNVSATGGTGILSDGKGVSIGYPTNSLTVNTGAVLTAKGYSGIEQPLSGSIVNLGGTIYAEAIGGTAFFGGKVNFTDPAALLSVTDILSDPANSKIAIAMDLSGYSFYSTGAVTLNAPQTQAESSTAEGTIFLGPNNLGGNILVWDGDNNGATTNGTLIALGTTHKDVDTIIVTPTATGQLMIPVGSKNGITIQGMTPGAQVEVASGSVNVESAAPLNSLTIKDLALKAPANQDAISINNNLSIMNFNNVLLVGGDSSSNVGGSGIYSHGHGDLDIYGRLEAIGGSSSGSSHSGGHGVFANGDMLINADIKAIGGNSVNESGGDGIHSEAAIILSGDIEAVGGNSDNTIGGNGIYASDEIDIKGAINATGGNSAIGISTSGTLTIESSGNVKATGGDSTGGIAGGNGITISNSGGLFLKTNGNLLTIGGSGSGTSRDGFGLAVTGDINIGTSAIMEAIGAPGISMHASYGNIHLSGELYAESTSNTTAFNNGKVVFESTDALLKVKDKVNDDRVGFGQIIIRKGAAVNNLSHVFYATGGVELRDNPIDLAVSNTTLGTMQVLALPVLDFTVPSFSAVEEGYTRPAAQSINISNSSIGAALSVNVASSNTNFEILPGHTTIGTGSDSSWQIQPKAGLAAGTYTADITLSADGISNKVEPVTFVVDTATAPSQSLTVNIASFASVQTGYTQPAPAAITLTNTGSANLSNVSASVSSGNFILNTGTDAIASGSTDTSWTIRPIAGLAAGTYTATVTVSASGIANITKQVIFVVSSYSQPQQNTDNADDNNNDDNNSSTDSFSNSSINPRTAGAKQKANGSHEDIIITLSDRGNTLNNVKNGNFVLKNGQDYAINGNKLTIKGGYLDTLSPGEHTLTLDMNRGTDPKLTLSIAAEEPTTQSTEPIVVTVTPSATWANPFSDINISDWFFADVKYAYENGLFSGTSDSTFSPQMPMTRGMVVTVLGRLAGINPANYSGASFGDVDREQYYAPFIIWAAESGIVSGLGDNSFAPDANISRQDLAVILNRYAEIMGIELKQTRQNVAFIDSDEIAEYAVESISNMVRAGVISGFEDGNFDPLVSATRAEVAAMLHRFVVAAK